MTKAGPCTGESGENNFRCKHARQTIQNEPQGVGNTRQGMERETQDKAGWRTFVSALCTHWNFVLLMIDNKPFLNNSTK